MKLAVFGGTGFLGYDFVRSILDDANIEFTVYSTSPKSLVNIARHDIDIRLLTPKNLGSEKLEPDTDFIINFSHPFGIRDELKPREQLDNFIKFVAKQKANNSRLRLIHISTMSVYEPFSESMEYSEQHRLKPPLSDSYATEKAYIETELLKLPDAQYWQLHLRPTVVYGPYCRPWTDRIMEALDKSDVPYVNLSGKIQPVYGNDITRFIRGMLEDFQSGIYNFAGDEAITWEEFLKMFSEIIGKGKLVFRPNARPSDFDASSGFVKFYGQNMKELLRVIIREPSFDRMAVPLTRRLPRCVVRWIRNKLVGDQIGTLQSERPISYFASPFFSQHRLVSMQKFKQNFPSFKFTKLGSTKAQLKNYYEYRFSDKLFL